MNQDKIIMSKKEIKYSNIMTMVIEEILSLTDACIRLGISYRHGIRIKQRYMESSCSPSALMHKSRGRKRDSGKDKNAILALYHSKYKDYGATLAAEKMCEEDGYSISRETLRLWLKKEGSYIPRRKRSQYRARRERRPRFGELLQVDGSIHDWLGNGEKQCLMNIVDDATGKTMSLLGPGETTELAFRTLLMWVEEHGIPLAVYVDLKSVYVSPNASRCQEADVGKRCDIETEMDGYVEHEWLTQYGALCKRLGTALIKAHSPQAKGRVERSHAVYQDRFVKELRLRNITTIEEANQLLLNGFIDKLNDKFMKEPASKEDAHIKLSGKEDLNEIFSSEYKRVLSKDYVVRFKNMFFQVSRSNNIHYPP